MKININEQWIPRKISFAFGEPVVELVRPSRVINSFFSDIDLNNPIQTARLPLMDIQLPVAADGLSPAGYLFHTPRSGSTLVARMLSVQKHSIILVEPEPINALLSSPQCSAVDAIWLQHLILLYRMAFYPDFNTMFLKTSSWSIIKLSLFESAFPQTPACMIYRNPVEVLVQILQRHTGWMADHARPFILGKPLAECELISTERFCAEALACFLSSAGNGSSSMLLIEYEKLPGLIYDSLFNHFGLTVSESERQSMNALFQLDSEDWSGKRQYSDDSAYLRSNATPGIKNLAQSLVLPVLRTLEDKANKNGVINAIL